MVSLDWLPAAGPCVSSLFEKNLFLRGTEMKGDREVGFDLSQVICFGGCSGALLGMAAPASLGTGLVPGGPHAEHALQAPLHPRDPEGALLGGESQGSGGAI